MSIATELKQECIETLEELQLTSSSIEAMKITVNDMKLSISKAYDVDQKVRNAVSTLATSHNESSLVHSQASSTTQDLMEFKTSKFQLNLYLYENINTLYISYFDCM